MHESPRRSNHLQRRLPKGEDRLKSAKHQGTNQPKRCGTEFNRQPQKRLRCVHNLGEMSCKIWEKMLHTLFKAESSSDSLVFANSTYQRLSAFFFPAALSTAELIWTRMS